MPKRKYIRTEDFRVVFAEDWDPVVLEGEAMPDFARAVPDAIRCCIIASGQDINTRPYSSRLVPSGYLVGGMEIYRHAPDDPLPLNKDWYAIVSSDDPDLLVVDGPYKDGEHWLSEIPTRYQGAKVIGSAYDDKGDLASTSSSLSRRSRAATEVNHGGTERIIDMRLEASPTELFNTWFAKPIEKLKELPEGSGAFAAMMIALPLYERLIIAKLKLDGKPTEEEDVKRAVCVDLHLNDHQRSIFWDMMRNGFMHQGMMKTGKTKWLVSYIFGELPEFRSVRGQSCLCIDPWKFADRVIKAFNSEPSLITASESFPLASVYSLPANEFSPP